MAQMMHEEVSHTQQQGDEQLMESYRNGDQAAFAVLYQRHKGALYRYFVRQLGVGQQLRAEELYQDVWCRVINHRDAYTVSAKFTTWLYSIAHNLMIDEHRRHLAEAANRARFSEINQSDETPSELSDGRQQASLKFCMTKLAPLQLEAFLLRHDAGFTPAQICDIVSAKPETIKTRLRYAMDNLRQCLQRKLGSRT